MIPIQLIFNQSESQNYMTFIIFKNATYLTCRDDNAQAKKQEFNKNC